MSEAANWARVKALFQQALDVDETARDAFVSRESAGNEDVLQEVRAMLAAHQNHATPLLGEARDLLDAPVSEPAALPDAIGPFKPVALIGRGGMGVVYRAERDVDGSKQIVALKLIAAGFSDRSLIRRFERERSILARLQHPHIAHFIDGGVTADGSPWLAMQYVDGHHLPCWCDTRRLTLRERVTVFLQVLDAVGFAHRNLVVHRDLKPSNILVDSNGQVRLLDFGIAKLLDDVAETPLTATAAAPMTPEYAAPEQILGEPVTTATDIHALGVVLFELLCGRMPYATGGGRRQAAAVIVGQEPQRMREALSRRGDASSRRNADAADIARSRSSTLPELRRELDRDLEQVVAIAIARAPGDRYRNVEAFTDDLRAWLDDRPLLSRSAGWRERARKFVRRHRIGVAVAAALFAVAATGVVATLWQAQRAQEQARRADAARRVLTELFQAADPQSMDGRALSARELVDQGAARLRTDTSLDADLRASLLTDLAGVYHSLGELKQARAMLGEVESTPGIRFETRVRALLRQARVANSASDYVGAEQLARTIAELLKPHDPRSPLRVDMRLLEAETAYQRQNLDKVVADMADLLRLLPAADAAQAHARGDALYLLGEAESDRRNHDLALQHLRQALREFERAGATSTTINSTRHEIARALGATNRFGEALPELNAVLAEHTRILGADHSLTLSTKGELADLFKRMNRFDEADRLFLEVIAAKRRTLGPEHDDLAVALMNYGTLRYLRDEFAASLPYFDEAARIWTKTFGADGDRTLIARDAVAAVHAELGDHARAIAEIESVVAARERAGEDDALTSAINTYGIVLDRAGQVRESCAQFRRAIAITTRLHSENSGQLRWPRALLGRCLRRSGDLASAESELRWARDSFLAAFPPGPRVATINIELARTLRARRGNAAEILHLYDEAVRLRREKLDSDHPKIAEAEQEREGGRQGLPLPSGL